MWVKTTSQVECDVQRCGARFGLEDTNVPAVAIVQAARLHGWHCFQGPSLTGQQLDVHICPQCIDRPTSTTSRAKPLPGDVPMFDETGTITVPTPD